MLEPTSKLEAARRLRGWSLAVASQKIGVHPRTLRRWETGKSQPHGFRVYKISEIYETTPTALGIGSARPQLFASGKRVPSVQHQLLTALVDQQITIEDLDLYLIGVILERKRDWQNLNYHAFQQQIDNCIKEYDAHMQARQVSSTPDSMRQQALRVVASIPITVYLENLTAHALPAPPEEILTHCASAITVCWHMGQGEDLALARTYASGYLILLSEVFTRAEHCRRATAELIAQACLLRTMLALHLAEPQIGVNYYTKALEFSQLADAAESPLAPRVPLHRRASYGREPAQALQKMAQSLWLLKPIAPPPDFSLIRNYLQKLSTAHQERGDGDYSEGEQLEFYQLPSTLDYAEAALGLWDGVTYHELDAYAHALDNTPPVSAKELSSDVSERIRLEFLPNRALAALRLHDMPRAITNLRVTLPQALSMGSEQYLLETREAYHLLQFLLPGDSSTAVAELKDLLKNHD